MEVSGHRKIRRPKLRWRDVTQRDMNETGVPCRKKKISRLEKVENENLTCRLRIIIIIIQHFYLRHISDSCGHSEAHYSLKHLQISVLIDNNIMIKI